MVATRYVVGLAAAALASAACNRVFEIEEVTSDAGGGTGDGDAAVLVPDGLVAWYRLDSLVGGQAIDSVGSHHGVCAGSTCPTVVPGVLGSAAAFNGTTNIIQVESDPVFETQAFTISAWVRLAPDHSDTDCFISKTYDTPPPYNSWQMCLESAAGRIVFYSHDGSNPHYLYGSALDPGTWYHVALCYDGSRKWIVLDGVESEMRTTTLAYDGGPVLIGADRDPGVGLVAQATATIDDIRIYDRVLSLGELFMLANEPRR